MVVSRKTTQVHIVQHPKFNLLQLISKQLAHLDLQLVPSVHSPPLHSTIAVDHLKVLSMKTVVQAPKLSQPLS